MKEQNKSAGSAQKQPGSSFGSVEGVFHRLKRKGNGFVVEKLTVKGGLVVSLKEVGDWDVRMVTENRALNELVSHCA